MQRLIPLGPENSDAAHLAQLTQIPYKLRPYKLRPRERGRGQLRHAVEGRVHVARGERQGQQARVVSLHPILVFRKDD